jgi:hypothetical protein
MNTTDRRPHVDQVTSQGGFPAKPAARRTNSFFVRIGRMMAIGTLVALLGLASGAVHAGRSCEARIPEVTSVQRSLELALSTSHALDQSGARVVLLARAGQDLSSYGLRWSHMGWAYKDATASADSWRVVHKLNSCGEATADLYRQGLAEFFLDDPFEFRAGFAVPTLEAQQRLLPLLQNNAQLSQLHQAAYSMVAYPWATQYQQSNQWALETLARAMEPSAVTREQAQAWLRLNAYVPTTLHLGPFTRLGARITAANVAFDDHPNEKRFANRIETTTVDSAFVWLRRSRLGGDLQELR